MRVSDESIKRWVSGPPTGVYEWSIDQLVLDLRDSRTAHREALAQIAELHRHLALVMSHEPEEPGVYAAALAALEESAPKEA